MDYCNACDRPAVFHRPGCKYEEPFRCPGCGRNVPLEKHVPGCGYPVRFECPDCQRTIPDKAHHPNCDYVGLIITHEEMTKYLRTWGPPQVYGLAQEILHDKRPNIPRTVRRWTA